MGGGGGSSGRWRAAAEQTNKTVALLQVLRGKEGKAAVRLRASVRLVVCVCG